MKTTLYAGAFLSVAVMVMTFSIISDGLFHSETPETFGYEIAEASGSAPAAANDGPAEIASIAPLLASADAAAGEKVFKKCAACHNVADGAANKVGPNLWSILGAKPGAHADFKYSSAMVAYGETGEPWGFESLNKFLLKPKTYIKGTSMGFAGLSKEADRANLLAYLNQQAATQLPYPEATEAPAAEEEAPATQ
ncbi:MAG: cytochrome c family protein [Pseudomonadota bacterium]